MLKRAMIGSLPRASPATGTVAASGPAVASALVRTVADPHIAKHFDLAAGDLPQNIELEPNGKADVNLALSRQAAQISPNGHKRVPATLPLPADGGVNTPVMDLALPRSASLCRPGWPGPPTERCTSATPPAATTSKAKSCSRGGRFDCQQRSWSIHLGRPKSHPTAAGRTERTQGRALKGRLLTMVPSPAVGRTVLSPAPGEADESALSPKQGPGRETHGVGFPGVEDDVERAAQGRGAAA
ncbi:hypothetical protein [Streptomyces sp. NPDC047000]|uniref:hypothetical protein n=1 Tax=Streptomyces sp. NPDC047000 TaxID=3155474 RepID=UPI0033D99220